MQLVRFGDEMNAGQLDALWKRNANLHNFWLMRTYSTIRYCSYFKNNFYTSLISETKPLNVK